MEGQNKNCENIQSCSWFKIKSDSEAECYYWLKKCCHSLAKERGSKLEERRMGKKFKEVCVESKKKWINGVKELSEMAPSLPVGGFIPTVQYSEIEDLRTENERLKGLLETTCISAKVLVKFLVYETNPLTRFDGIEFAKTFEHEIKAILKELEG